MATKKNEVTTITAGVEIKSPALIEKTAKIRQYEGGVKSSLYGIANILHEIDKGGLYKEDGFKNVTEYASKVFGYKKTMVYNMLQVAENYLVTGENKTIFSAGEKDFSMGQVQELLALPPAKGKELVKSGAVNAEMTTKEIRDVVKANKPQREKSGKQKAKELANKQKKAAEKISSQQENTTAENPAKENKHVKKIEKIFSEMIADLNTLKVEKTETEKLAKIMQGVVDLRKEMGLLTI